jgi:hypothetical protein
MLVMCVNRVRPAAPEPDLRSSVRVRSLILSPRYKLQRPFWSLFTDGDRRGPFTAKLKKDVWTVSGTAHCPDGAGGISSTCAGGTAVVQIPKQDAHIASMIHYK